MTVLSLLNPFGWFGWGGPAKLSGGNQPSGADPISYSGKPVTPERALELAAYWACVRLIAQTIGTLSCKLYTQAADGSRLPAVDDPLYDLLLHQPNADHTAVEFWEGVGACLGIWGNSFALKGIVGNRLVSLNLLRPWHMQVLRDEAGEPVYRYNDPVLGLQTYGPDDLFVVRGFGLCDLTGFAPIQFARQTIGSAIAADEAAGSLFRNGLRASGWFKYKGGNGILNAQQQEDTRAALIKPYVGSENTGKVGLLPGDFDWLATAMIPEDAQLLESRRMNVEEICRFFGVPPILVGHSAQGQTMWGTGVDSIVLGWMTTGLRPYLKRIEAAIARCIIGRSARQSLVVAFDVTELLRGDNKGQSEIDQSLANTGIKTRNEIRAERNLPPKPGGDTLTVQSALLPIEDLGQVAKLPNDKVVDPSADVHNEVAQNDEAKRLVRVVDMALKYSEDQPRDPHGRFAGGSSGDSDGSAKKPLLSNRTLIKVGTFLGTAAAVSAAVALKKGKPYNVATNTAVHDVHRAFHAASLREPLSEAETKAIHDYTAHDFAAINQRLRLKNKTNASIDSIDSALRKASLSQDTVVYRGLNMDRSKRILATPPGQMFLDRGYPSTTVHEHVGRRFSQTVSGAPAPASKRGYVVSINVDKGTNALPLHPDHVRFGDEHEVLLPRGSAFKMLRVDHDTKTIYAQHVGTIHETKATSKSFDDVDPGDKGSWSDDDLEWFEMPVDDTTADDYADYVPPRPGGARKAFDPSEARDEHGEWTAGGGSSSGSGGSSQNWDAAKHEAMLVVKGTAIVAGAALAVFFAPEIAGAAAAITGSEAIGAGTAAAIPWIAKQSRTIADGFFGSAVYQAGLSIAKNQGYDTSKVEQMLRPYTEPFGVYGKSAAGKDIDEPQLRKSLAGVVDSACGELLAAADRSAPKNVDATHVKAVKETVQQARDKFKARLLSGDAS